MVNMKKIDFKKPLFVSKWTSVIALILIQSACDVGTFSVSGQNVGTTSPTSLIYSNPNAVYKAGKTISENSPTNSGGEVTSYSILPALPNGLLFNPSTGKITGTPNCLAQSIVYSITATNSTGSTTSSVLIQIVAGDPTNISFTTGLAGDAQNAITGTTLPAAFSATVTDLRGNPTSGATVIWSVTAGGGTLSATTASANNSGIVTSTLTLGPTSGINTVKATIQGTVNFATFTAKATSPLTSNIWNLILANASSYDYRGLIDFNGPSNVCELSPTPQTDQDNSSNGFGGATLSGLLWDSSNNIIRIDPSQITPRELSTSNWTPKTANIMAIWNLNEPAGTTSLTDSAGANTGTAINATLGVRAQQGTGAIFDGTSSVLDMGPGFNFTSSPFSFSYWINLSTFTTDASNQGPVAIYKGNYNTNGYYNQITSDGSVSFATNQSGSVQVSNTAAGALSLGTWHHIAITRTGPSVRIYVDGVDATASAGNHADPVSSNDHFYLGSYPPIPIHMNGSMDEVGVWNTNLTATDVAIIYQHQKDRYGGTLTSRIFDGLSTSENLTSANWTSLTWTSILPFFKELTDFSSGALQNETTADYPSLVGSTGTAGENNLMRGITGLWHLNENSYTGAANEVKDDSGNGNSGTTTAGVSTAPGLFGGAASFNAPGADGNSVINFGNMAGANFGVSDFTLSAWIKTFSTSSQFILSKRPVCNHSSFWNLYLSGGKPLIELDGDSGATNYKTFAGTQQVNDGQWHHILFIRNQNNLALYADGIMIGSATSGIANLSSTANLTLNGNPCSTSANVFQGQIDEVGIWSRALNSKEVVQLYRRGSNRIKFQVRSCTAANCSDDSTNTNWKGPNGTAQTYFSELNNNSVPNGSGGSVKRTLPFMNFSNFTTPPFTSRYFQYRAIFESDDTSGNCNYGAGPAACSPELKSVAIGPNHYDTSAPSVVTKTGISFYSLSGAIETVGSGGCSSGVVYNLGYGASYDTATWYYYNAGSWLISRGTASTSNSAVSLNASRAAALATFGNQIGTGTVYLKAFLQSSGKSPCQLNSFEFDGLN